MASIANRAAGQFGRVLRHAPVFASDPEIIGQGVGGVARIHRIERAQEVRRNQSVVRYGVVIKLAGGIAGKYVADIFPSVAYLSLHDQ
jgi:hypothetical protein